jgi:hypothetical protein
VENFVVSLEFLGGVACLFAFGQLIGHLLKLDKFYDDPDDKNKRNQKSTLRI